MAVASSIGIGLNLGDSIFIFDSRDAWCPTVGSSLMGARHGDQEDLPECWGLQKQVATGPTLSWTNELDR